MHVKDVSNTSLHACKQQALRRAFEQYAESSTLTLCSIMLLVSVVLSRDVGMHMRMPDFIVTELRHLVSKP